MYKQTLINRFGSVNPDTKEKDGSLGIYVLSAVLGDLTGSLWLCPSEVIKQTLQAKVYPNPSAAVAGVISQSGVFGGLYKGYFGNVARDVPFRVFSMCTYEVLKKRIVAHKIRKLKEQRSQGKLDHSKHFELTALETAFGGALAGSFSAALTTPLDKVKTIIMTRARTSGSAPESYASVLTEVYRNEGIRGMFGGVVPRVGLIGPSVGVFFIVYEETIKWFKGREAARRERENVVGLGDQEL
jgi:solute carrier family 25 S-adenosylmethionine transporter 26